jgi:Holliday junction DNA helicase RuvA
MYDNDFHATLKISDEVQCITQRIKMLDFLQGKIVGVHDKTITVAVGGIGFAVHVPQARNYVPDADIRLHTYLHWNQENGPSVYGFVTEIERKVFLLIINCPKIGPSIAMTILSQVSASEFLEMITAGSDSALSNLNGIGSKKAEQLIVELRSKVQKLINSGELAVEKQQSFVQWQQLSEVLTSLNYSKPEVIKATQYVAEKYTGQNYPIDQLIRAALSYLSEKHV